MKKSRTVPIHKTGAKLNKCNYRPISTLPFLSKVYERLINSRILKFLNKFNVLYENQFGFLKHRSTTDAILSFTDNCYNCLNNSEYMINICIDFSRAFDTVDHDILCQKLEYCGFRGTMNRWFRSYLEGRSQVVDINGSISRPSSIRCSVPQGSILGPLCFLIYINDMNRCADLNFIHFADDSTVFAAASSLPVLVDRVNAGLVGIDTWLCANRLSLNISKSFFSIFTNRPIDRLPQLTIRNQSLTHVKSMKFLGILIDDRLSFSQQITSVCSKVSRSLAVIRKLSRMVPICVLRNLYLSLVYPHVTYGVEVWGSSSKTGLTRLRSLLVGCVGLVGGDGAGGDVFGRLGLLSYDQVYRYFTLIRLYKYVKLDFSDYFSSKFLNCAVNHGILTRFSINHNLNLPIISKSVYRNSFFVNAIKFWNNLPAHIKNSSSVHIFKKHLRSLDNL